ncbi:MAG: glycosyltransferase family 4 protein [Chlamydiales bacterium]|nr:glycosyltransferase family 4 protein [Chlamydiales bacterium]
MRVVAITVGQANAGSTRFRIMQYLPYLVSEGVELQTIPQDELDSSSLDLVRSADVVINQKCLLKRSVAREIVGASQRLIFDFDDAIYTRPGKPYSWLTQWRVLSRYRYWLKAADVVTVANAELAKSAKKYAQDVQVLPMGINLTDWQPKQRLNDEQFRIGWVGAPNNLVYLERLDPVLQSLCKRFPNIRISVFSGQKPNLSCPFEYVPFIPGGEVDFIQKLDVGLLPMEDDEYSRGKSPIKAIQYLACGVPVVGNFVGAANEICNDSNSLKVSTDWEQGIATLAADQGLRERLGAAGRRHIELHHDADKLGKRLKDIFKGH